FRRAEARRVPLDAFGNPWVGAENDLPEGEDFVLERVVQRREERFHAFGLARWWLLARRFQSTLLVPPGPSDSSVRRVPGTVSGRCPARQRGARPRRTARDSRAPGPSRPR